MSTGLLEFMLKAQAGATEVIAVVEDEPSTAGFLASLEELDNSATKLSITDEQFLKLKRLIDGYRTEIMKGSFQQTTEKLHNIVMYYRVSRETAFTAIKVKTAKVIKEKVARVSKPKKAVIIINDLM